MSTKALKIIAITESVLLLLGIIAGVWYFFIRDTSPETVPANANVSADSTEVRVRPVLEKEEVYYQYDGRKILVHDPAYGETFIPVFADVPVNELDSEGFEERKGRIVYKEGDNLGAVSGVDISDHQGDIDWEVVKDSGIDFAMVRVGYRTYGGGVLHLDEHFGDNIRAAQAAGLETGVYFYSQAVTVDEAIEEADVLLDAVSGLDLTYPVVFDWEMIFDDSARTDYVSVETLADMCVSFCERVRAAGYTPMIYQNRSTAMKKLDLPRIADYEFWLAEYDDEPSYYYEFGMWQYTNSGSVPGIDGPVDINLCFKDYSADGVKFSLEDSYITEPDTEPAEDESMEDKEDSGSDKAADTEDVEEE